MDGSGRTLPFQYSWSGDQMVTAAPPGRVDLATDSAAFVAINKYRCDAGNLMTASTVRLIPPDDTLALELAITQIGPMAYCGARDPGSTLHASPVEPNSEATAPSR